MVIEDTAMDNLVQEIAANTFKVNNVTFVVENKSVIDDAENNDNIVFLDPAGSAFYSSYETSMFFGGGVSGVLYNYAKIYGNRLKDIFTEDEFNKVKWRDGSSYKKYTNCDIIHVISTNFGDEKNYTVNKIRDKLEESYRQVYDEFKKNYNNQTNEFRMIVLSGGIYSGEFKNEILELTPGVVVDIFNRYEVPNTIIYIYEYDHTSYNKLLEGFHNLNHK